MDSSLTDYDHYQEENYENKWGNRCMDCNDKPAQPCEGPEPDGRCKECREKHYILREAQSAFEVSDSAAHAHTNRSLDVIVAFFSKGASSFTKKVGLSIVTQSDKTIAQKIAALMSLWFERRG
jgi:hypothetical protein